MKLQDVLNEYKFENVGQFRAIAQSLGYKESYDSGMLHFSLNDDSFETSIDEIRSYTKKGKDTELDRLSMERLSQFFDRENALSENENLKKNGVDIINWGDLNNDTKDRFTVIDHQHKICYTGKALYDYATENGYLLDGNGTKLEKGELSKLTKINGKQAKIRLTENGKAIFYKKEALIIPDRICGKSLSQKQKKDLLDGNYVVLAGDKGDIFLQVDRDLNAVVIRSHKELSIPTEIGGYKLTTADKYLLANGYSLDNKLLKGDEGYFIANVKLTSDSKGYEISHIQMIPEAKAQDILSEKYINEQLKVMQKTGDILVDEMGNEKYKNLVNEKFPLEVERQALAEPDENKRQELKGDIRYKAGEILEGKGLLNKGTTEKELTNEGYDVKTIRERLQKNIKETTTEIQISGRDFELELKEAISNKDYLKIAELHNDGYNPSDEVIRGFCTEANLSPSDITEIGRLFTKEPVQQKENNLPTEGPGSSELKLTEQDKTFRTAVENGDFSLLSSMNEQGYKPTKEIMQSLVEIVPEGNIVAVEKIFNLKTIAPSLGEVKLSKDTSKETELQRPILNTVNQMFNNL